MYKKRRLFFVAIALLLTGCTRVTSNLDEIVQATMSKDNAYVNTVSTGYEIYIPTGVKQIIDKEYNQKLEIRDTDVYLYVDTISYYYKNKLNYKAAGTYNYYYKEIALNNKVGYIGINKLDDGSYFGEIVFNYSKMEFYADKDNLPVIVADCLIIVNSIKYNDKLISIDIGEASNEGRDIKYELNKPKDSDSTFNQYLQEYVEKESEEVVLPDDE